MSCLITADATASAVLVVMGGQYRVRLPLCENHALLLERKDGQILFDREAVLRAR